MSLRNKLSGAFRSRRAALIRQLICHISQSDKRISILDIGGRMPYWDQIGLSFLRERKVKITILNLHGSELIGMNADDVFEQVVGDACCLDFEDGQFDFAHSNSVIEHVGTWRNMKAFASEARRVSKNYYIQTPYFWFPIDPHFYAFPMFHWLPRPLRARLVHELPLAAAGRIRGVDRSFEAIDGARLLDASQFRFLFPDSTVRFERFMGLPKSMIAIRQCS
jgi:hypothetical protein